MTSVRPPPSVERVVERDRQRFLADLQTLLREQLDDDTFVEHLGFAQERHHYASLAASSALQFGLMLAGDAVRARAAAHVAAAVLILEQRQPVAAGDVYQLLRALCRGEGSVR